MSGNAIRTVGHVTSLAERQYDEANDAQELSKIESLYRDTLSVLVIKVKRSLDEASLAETPASWKQKSDLKRQGWGACNSMILLFGCQNFMNNDEMDEHLRNALEVLVQCLDISNGIHEKISLAVDTQLEVSGKINSC